MAEPSAIAPLFDRYQLDSAVGRTPWYKQYRATDMRHNDQVSVKVIRIAPGGVRGDLHELHRWYAEHLARLSGVVPPRSIHPVDDQLYIFEQLPAAQPWDEVMSAAASSPESRLQRIRELLARFEQLHAVGVSHNCLLPTNVLFDPHQGWLLADCGWLQWCCQHGYAPADARLPEAWTPMADGHQLASLIAYTLLDIDITTADIPLRVTTELKRRTRDLPPPIPAALIQLWGPAITETWSPMKSGRLVLEGRTDIPVPAGADLPPPPPPAPAVGFGSTPSLPIAGSIASAAAISAGQGGSPLRSGRPAPELPAMSESSAVGIGIPVGVPQTRDQRRAESTFYVRSVFFALLIATAFTGGLLYALAAFLFRPTVQPRQVPDVVGMTMASAKKSVERQGFSLTISGAEYSQEVPRDKILRQSPGPNTTVKEFREIFVTLSRGARTIKLPSLIGLEEKAAVESLTKLELKPGRISYEYARGVPAGQVIDQDPPANQLLAKEEPVHLVVSRGALKSEVRMPKVTDRPLSTALTQLAEAGLQVRKIVRRYSYEATTTTVSLQTPTPGAILEEGDTVSLTVTAPGGQEPLGDFQVRINIALPPYDGQRQVRIVIRDGRGERQVYSKEHSGGDKVELLADAYQTTRVLIYVNGRLLREEQY